VLSALVRPDCQIRLLLTTSARFLTLISTLALSELGAVIEQEMVLARNSKARFQLDPKVELNIQLNSYMLKRRREHGNQPYCLLFVTSRNIQEIPLT
jgi:hypothetical protein